MAGGCNVVVAVVVVVVLRSKAMSIDLGRSALLEGD